MTTAIAPPFINKDEEMSRKSHSYLTALLSYLLLDHLRRHQLPGLIYADADVIFPNSGQRLRPDLVYLTDVQGDWEANITTVPEIIIEILSDSSYLEDTVTKKYFYASEGVAEYWIVSTSLQSIHIYTLTDGQYTLYQQATEKGILHSKVLNSLQLDVEQVFHH